MSRVEHRATITLDPRSDAPLRDLCAQLLADPGRHRLVVALIDITPARPDPGDPYRHVAYANLRHTGVISDDVDRRIGRLLLRREYERRAGKTVMPWALEQHVAGILDAIAVQTPTEGTE